MERDGPAGEEGRTGSLLVIHGQRMCRTLVVCVAALALLNTPYQDCRSVNALKTISFRQEHKSRWDTTTVLPGLSLPLRSSTAGPREWFLSWRQELRANDLNPITGYSSPKADFSPLRAKHNDPSPCELYKNAKTWNDLRDRCDSV